LHIFIASVIDNDDFVIKREIKKFYDGIIGVDSEELNDFELSLLLKGKKVHSGIIGNNIIIMYRE
jgi:hypothetical protein